MNQRFLQQLLFHLHYLLLFGKVALLPVFIGFTIPANAQKIGTIVDHTKKTGPQLSIHANLQKLSAGQRTVGLTYSSGHATEAYTLFSPITSKNVYLINHCGEKVHEWNTQYQPGLGMAIKPNGHIVRSGRTNNPHFGSGGGVGGQLEIIDWNSHVLWSYAYSSEKHVQHHDICVLPNGNILILVWAYKTVQQAIDAGRNPAFIPEKGLWTEQVLELQPIGHDSAAIVWQWDVWNHLVQDHDSTKANYGTIAQHPEKVNLNQNRGTPEEGWVHLNAVDYNPETDEVMLSSRMFNEVWIIDHSTTTAQAATNRGGQYNRGGSILFRYGNPQTYHRGNATHQRLYAQHLAHWIPAGNKHAGAIMVFNNGVNRPTGMYSTVDVVMPQRLPDCSYALNPDGQYIATPLWTYNDSNRIGNFFNHRISGATMLPNGHVQICSGTWGRFFEVDTNQNKTWEYVAPFDADGSILTQGSVPRINANSVFETIVLFANHPALQGKNLTPKGAIELTPYPPLCVKEGIHINPYLFRISINPEQTEATVEVDNFNGPYNLTVSTLWGQPVYSTPVVSASSTINLRYLAGGAYWVTLTHPSGQKQLNRFVKF